MKTSSSSSAAFSKGENKIKNPKESGLAALLHREIKTTPPFGYKHLQKPGPDLGMIKYLLSASGEDPRSFLAG